MYNQDLFQKSKIESNITGDNNYVTNDMNIDVNMMNMNTTNNSNMNGGGCNQPVNEGVQERVVHRTFLHEVPQLSPIMQYQRDK